MAYVMRLVKLNCFRLAGAAILSGLLVWRFHFEDNVAGAEIFSVPPGPLQQRCSSLPGASDTVVVLKTGSTELQEKLPVHLETTTRCYPNYMIFSDYDEYYQGEHIINALESVDQDIRENHPDFELYRHLKKHGREGVQPAGVAGGNTEIKPNGNSENPGWKLDKWKFLPMMNRTLHEYPNMKWYIFAEVDTYILWASMLQYLAVLDHKESVYMGSQMFIGPDIFAHGGSGFIVSQPAMRALVSYYASHKRDLERAVDAHWAGDCVLGRSFTNAGVHFTNSWPIIQGDYPGIVAYARPDGRPVADVSVRIWCYPVVTYHHVSPEAIRDLWNFEQHWIENQNGSINGFLQHKDVFDQYIMPRMSATPRLGWDNESDKTESGVDSLEQCQTSCRQDVNCRQFSFEESTGICKTREDPRLGISKVGFRSGWLLDRMEEFREKMAPCHEEGWLM